MSGLLLALLLSPLAGLPAAAAEKNSQLIGSVVRSERWSVRRSPHKVEELSGDVTYDRRDRFLRADWALYDHDSEQVEAKGSIRAEGVLQDGSRVKAYGEKGRYAARSQRGGLSGRDGKERIRFSMEDRPGGGAVFVGTGTARDLAWDGGAQTVVLRGDVQAQGSRGALRADSVTYDAAADRMDLIGRRPVFLAREPAWSASVQADQVSAFRRPAGRWLVSGDGAARGWIHFPESERWKAGR